MVCEFQSQSHCDQWKLAKNLSRHIWLRGGGGKSNNNSHKIKLRIYLFPRYRDVNPYDHSRIILNRPNIETDYINANLVKLERAKRHYILCQGPLEFTVGHFWLMAWENQSKAILMLNKIIEKKQIKCHPYWPKEGQKLDLHDVGLTVEFLTTENFKNFSKRLFRITDMESTKSREIIQFHYTQVRMIHL